MIPRLRIRIITLLKCAKHFELDIRHLLCLFEARHELHVVRVAGTGSLGVDDGVGEIVLALL
jgi:hypothetical protein